MTTVKTLREIRKKKKERHLTKTAHRPTQDVTQSGVTRRHPFSLAHCTFDTLIADAVREHCMQRECG